MRPEGLSELSPLATCIRAGLEPTTPLRVGAKTLAGKAMRREGLSAPSQLVAVVRVGLEPTVPSNAGVPCRFAQVDIT